jgi:2-hydroxychromene-2-carboxylate isomerase
LIKMRGNRQPVRARADDGDLAEVDWSRRHIATLGLPPNIG